MAAHDTAVRATLETMEHAGRYNDWLYERARPHLGERVLDVGAGAGTFTERLLEDGRTVVAAEPDPELVRALRARLETSPRLTIVAGVVKDVDGEFDTAVCFNVLEHIPDHAAALADMRDRLETGGRLLLLVPAHPRLYGGVDRAIAHERRYSVSGLRSLLERAGFTVETVRPVNPIGAVGWFVSGRVLGRDRIPEGPLRLYDLLVPLLRPLDALRLPFGLSLWAVARAA